MIHKIQRQDLFAEQTVKIHDVYILNNYDFEQITVVKYVCQDDIGFG